MKPPAGDTDQAHSFIRSRPTRDHSHRRRPPLGANTSRHEGNRAVKTLVDAVAYNLGPPRTGTEDLVERLRMPRAGGGPLLNQHVQLAPHHVDEQLDPTLGGQPAGW